MPNEEFQQTLPPPNAGYWITDGYSNTQIEPWMDTVIGDVVDNPLTRVNKEPDIYLNVYSPVYSIPTDGNVAEYDFIQRANTQQLYDIGPAPSYNGVLGSTTSVDINDPTWVSTGLRFQGTYVNCISVPVNPLEQTIIVVARVDNLDQNTSIIGCIDTDNAANCTGYSIDILIDKSVVFRTQKNVASPAGMYVLTTSYPSNSIALGGWFFAALRYKSNKIVGNLNNLSSVQNQYSINVESLGIINNTKGYFIGNQGYVIPLSGGSFWGGSSFSNSNSNTGQPLMDGIVGYTLIYDVYLEDSSIDSIYNVLKTSLASRPITLP
jgi:hypothetical protein